MEKEKKITAILHEKNLRNTPTRRRILELFFQSSYALSPGDIDSMTNHEFDRVTVYRTLKTFVDEGVIHEVIDDESKVKYNLCSDGCTVKAHHDNHLHFKCEKCDHTFCLTGTTIPEIALPAAYEPHSVKVLITGLCEKCV